MYRPTAERVSFPFRGTTSSKTLNKIMDQLVTDVNGISLEQAAIDSELKEFMKNIVDDNRFLKRRVAQLEQQKSAEDLVRGRNNLRLTHHQSMYEVRNLKFFNVTHFTPQVNPTYGIATLPVNAVESKFVRNSVYNGEIIAPMSLDVQVSSVFADEGVSTPTNHEAGAKKTIAGTPANAFNGSNQSYWVRTVEFDLDSDVHEVQAEMIVTVPKQNNTRSNVMTIHPYPVGGVDIIDISVSPDLTSSFTKVNFYDAPSFQNPWNNSRERYIVFPAQDIDQVRVRLRQRNFIEENNKKVFRYGLQELGLFLIDFEKQSAALDFSSWSQQTNSETISMAHEISPPKGFYFTALHHFSASPDYTLESLNNRHVIYRIYDGDPTTGVGNEIWNSNQTAPQNQPPSVGSQITLGGNITKLFVTTSMRFTETSGGVASPYLAGTPPFINGFSMEYSVSPGF